MENPTARRQDHWTGRLGFILATIGSAVGLGSIWKFPYEVGANGGSSFVLLYLLGLVLIVVPLMFAEFALGRRGQGDPATALSVLAARHRASRRWTWIGVVGVATGFLVLSFYAVIGGWTLGYALQTVVQGLPGTEPQRVAQRFDEFLASPLSLIAYQAVFLALTAAIVARGVVRGIEAASKILMPLLAVLMIFLAGYSVVEGDVARTVEFLLRFDPAGFNARSALDALGLGFFFIGVGMGLMITYAAYGGPEVDLRQVAVVSVLGDTAISFLAGLTVFPIVFANGLDPAAGPGLVFVTLPLAFARMPFGTLVAVAFFVLLLVAALASAISMLELVVAPLVRRFGWTRPRACLAASLACFVAGLATVFSFNEWAQWHPLGMVSGFETATVYDLVDHLTSNVMLPLTGLAISIFAGWVLPANVLVDELRLGAAASRVLVSLLRYVVPPAILLTALAPVFV